MSPEYVDSVWWSLKKIFDDGKMSEDFRVTPYCPRCGTALSDHEVAQGYENVKDPSVYVRFPLVEPLAGHADAELLIWTTTPGRSSPTPRSPSTPTSPTCLRRTTRDVRGGAAADGGGAG